MSAGFFRTGRPNVAMEDVRGTSAVGPNVDATLVHNASTDLMVERNAQPPGKITVGEAKASGYTGTFCDVCGSFRMRMAGHCTVCEECGSTTGCS